MVWDLGVFHVNGRSWDWMENRPIDRPVDGTRGFSQGVLLQHEPCLR